MKEDCQSCYLLKVAPTKDWIACFNINSTQSCSAVFLGKLDLTDFHTAAINWGIHLLVVMKDIKATSLILGTEVGQKEIKLLVKTTSGFIKNSQRHRSSIVLYEALFSVNSTHDWVNFILLNPSSMLEMKTVMTSAKLRRQREGAKEGERKRVGIFYKGLTITATTKYHKANGASTKKNPKVHRHLLFSSLYDVKTTLSSNPNLSSSHCGWLEI